MAIVFFLEGKMTIALKEVKLWVARIECSKQPIDPGPFFVCLDLLTLPSILIEGLMQAKRKEVGRLGRPLELLRLVLTSTEQTNWELPTFISEWQSLKTLHFST